MKNNFLSISRLVSLVSLFFIIGYAKAQVPVADFKVCKQVVEIYSTLDLYDLSTNNPNTWKWDIFDSSGSKDMIAEGSVYPDANANGRNEFSKNPQIMFSEVGCYTIKLTSGNASGTSTPIVKYCVVEVVEPAFYYPGYGNYGPIQDNHIYSEYGEIMDNGGLNSNYTNDQGFGTKSYLKITPNNDSKITFKFDKIKLADDTIRIYDADTVNPSKLLAAITSADNGTTKTYVTTGTEAYFIFNSNGSNTDSGYHILYYTTQNPLLPLNNQIITMNNAVNHPSVFVNRNKSVMALNHAREWFVNDTLQPAFTNKDTLLHTFYNLATYKVCITISNCDTSYSNCINNNNTPCEARFKVSSDANNTFSGIITDQSATSGSASYLWSFGDGDSSHSKTPVHTYGGQGKYNLCLTVIDGSCTSTYCDSIGFDASGNLTAVTSPFTIKIVDRNGLSTRNPNYVSMLDLYPNPASDILYIKNANSNIALVIVVNVLGKEIYHISNVSSETTINMSTLPSGMYFIKAMDKAGNTNTFKIIKN